MVHELNWRGCYSKQLKGAIHDDAFSHPAKFSAGLIKRIYEHGLERGYWQEGDLVADPFAGVGIGGIFAAAYGLRWIGVELEEKFVDLANKSFELHYDAWDKMGKPRPIILQGDSRNFSSIIREAVGSIITSPPYTKDVEPHRAIPMEEWRGTEKWGGPHSVVRAQGYPRSEGQIGAMKEGKLDKVVAVITSPPYAESLQPETEEQTRRKQERIAKAKTIHDGRALEKPSPGKAALGGGYGVSEGQLGTMSEGNHETVVNGIVTSPPFEKGTGDSERPCKLTQEYADKYSYGTFRKWYGNSNGQIGQEQTATYWSSVVQVYSECWKALKPRGIMVVVVKDFVRQKKRVPLCDQTFELLQAIGFKPLERIKAWLVESEYPTTLFSEEEEHYLYEAHERERRAKYKARAATAKAEGRQLSAYRPHTFDGWLAAWRQKKKASFFRRDTEIKGSPRIEWEEVLIFQRPNDNPNHNSLVPQQKTRT